MKPRVAGSVDSAGTKVKVFISSAGMDEKLSG
jgi:hypothetical protein